jgi:hypothetical protein
MPELNSDRSFRNLLPGFVIPAGTQVMLKAAKVLPGGAHCKPRGNAAVDKIIGRQ